jgi:RimJ/RimL family protein N-acetyltransferase
VIRPLREEDAESFVVLRREALGDAPLAFASSPDDDSVSDPAAVREHLRRGPDTVILGAFDGQRLVGAVGIYRDRHVKASHKSHLWGMYVTPSGRRAGVASELLGASIRHAETLAGVSWIHLAVSSASTGALRLYESVGFRPWGTEPEALRHGGQAVSLVHMALRLRG